MNYIYTEHDYLAHYGVKGMKWGVRKAIERTKDSASRFGRHVTNQGLIRGGLQWNAENINRRLNNFSDKRKQSMSWRQKRSYEDAKKYWAQRAAGKSSSQIKRSGTNYRGFIRRSADSWRSRGLGHRTAITAAQYAADAVRANAARKVLGVETNSVTYNAGMVAANTALSNVGDYLVSKIFGHF